jgi:hypothetical protein
LILLFFVVAEKVSDDGAMMEGPSECFEVWEHLRIPLHFACNQDAPAVVIQSLLITYPKASLLTRTTIRSCCSIIEKNNSNEIIVMK